MFQKKQSFLLGALLALAACSKEDATPVPRVAPGTANNVAPIDPPTGGGGGGGGSACVAPTASIKNGIRSYTTRECRLNGWTIVETITPPDGITYGLGCGGVYRFSVDIIVENTGQSTYASGTYNSGTGAYTLSL
ncbi:hypothetical protein [Hymenobacter sp.]|uniref:hypothetical protein n=1 Tax=Hymenobacter sp. TaxID=1898978 RepID=UPI00286AFC82|nr:hypothetical protein [Hymenobacter sp.]